MIERDERKIKSVYKRFETDEEFRIRLIAAGVPKTDAYYWRSDALDEWGWKWKQMQRRIVDGET